jgi:hypothetical protein
VLLGHVCDIVADLKGVLGQIDGPQDFAHGTTPSVLVVLVVIEIKMITMVVQEKMSKSKIGLEVLPSFTGCMG